MEIKLFGQKMRLEIIIISMLIGAFIAVNAFCSCAGGLKEGFAAGSNMVGAALDYSMGNGVSVSWEADSNDAVSGDSSTWFKHLEANKAGPVPLQEGQLFMFGDNKFDGSCCPSTYSNSMGCACLSQEQAQYLNQRGGNRTLTSNY